MEIYHIYIYPYILDIRSYIDPIVWPCWKGVRYVTRFTQGRHLNKARQGSWATLLWIPPGQSGEGHGRRIKKTMVTMVCGEYMWSNAVIDGEYHCTIIRISLLIRLCMIYTYIYNIYIYTMYIYIYLYDVRRFTNHHGLSVWYAITFDASCSVHVELAFLNIYFLFPQAIGQTHVLDGIDM